MRAFHHLQVLDDAEVETELHLLIPQIEAWLLGTLPVPDKDDQNGPDDHGIVLPQARNVKKTLLPLRKLIYDGVPNPNMSCIFICVG